MALVAALVNVRLPPLQTGFGDAFAVTDVGAVFTVTATVIDIEPHAFIAVMV